MTLRKLEAEFCLKLRIWALEDGLVIEEVRLPGTFGGVALKIRIVNPGETARYVPLSGGAD